MSRYFDTHAHYWDDRFSEEIDGGADALLDTLLSSDVDGIVNVGTSPETSLLAIGQAKRHNRMYAAAGIHPSDCASIENAEEALFAIEELFSHPENKLVALGEIGLDYHYTPFDREKQHFFFHSQLALARKLSVPVIVHDREAHGDSMDVVLAHKDTWGVFHSYSGSVEMAKELIKRGYYISFSGTVSFKNAARVAAVAEALPRDRVLIETDAPYLTPHPFRGRMNHSGYLKYTCDAIGALWGMSADEVADITRQNALRFFSIKDQ